MISKLKGLYAITDSTLMPDDATLLESVEQAIDGGAGIIQYRDKSADSAKRLRQAIALNKLCRDNDTLFIVNDDTELALASMAHGVHLGQKDGNLLAARQRLGNNAIIGVTCHDQLQLAKTAEALGANYVALGAFVPSKTKPNATFAPLSLIAQVRLEVSCPIVAIGGITVDNAHQIINAGADMVAVIHALFSAPSIRQQALNFSELFNR